MSGAIRVGDEIPTVDFVADTGAMKLMAALLNDPNPIHFDVESVRALGLGDRVITQGPMTLSFLADTLTAWAGGPGSLRSLQVRMLDKVFGGDTVTCGGRVTAVDEGGLVSLEVVASIGDRQVIAGTATVVALR
jgi:acyl dehydratase